MSGTTLKKNRNGYNYQYTDLAEIHEHLEEQGYTYHQYVETVDGADYVYTVIHSDGKQGPPIRGCRVVPNGGKNATQEYGKALTYARRYSLLMAFGLCTTDDDAQVGASPAETAPKRPDTVYANIASPPNVKPAQTGAQSTTGDPVSFQPGSRGEVQDDYKKLSREAFVQKMGANAPVEYLLYLNNEGGQSWETISSIVSNYTKEQLEEFVKQWRLANG